VSTGRLPYEVLVLVRRGDEWLVLHRSERQGSYWHSVAGALEEGESWAQAAARELEEEVGLVAAPVEVAEPYAYSVEEFPDFRKRLPPGTREVVVRTFVVDAPPGWEPRLDWEHDDYRWCVAGDALALLRWPEPRDVLAGLAGSA
jgi:8-oxo-dGTP pyrophosphatase MutT (NUDIX family)